MTGPTGMYMYDSTTASEIREDAQIVAGYIDGLYAWSEADWARFPNAKHVLIVTNPLNGGDVYDCEPGNRSDDPYVWPAQAVDWATRRVAAGIVPTIYCDRNDWPILRTAITNAGLECAWWIAAPHTQPSEMDGAIAVQFAFANDPAACGKNVDVSYVYGPPLLPELPPVPTLPEIPPFPGYAIYGEGMYPNPPNEAVRQFQAQLEARGYDCGGADGRDGPNTTNTMKRFQADAEIETDGVGGPITWEKLWS